MKKMKSRNYILLHSISMNNPDIIAFGQALGQSGEDIRIGLDPTKCAYCGRQLPPEFLVR